jgi:hypothetical protein
MGCHVKNDYDILESCHLHTGRSENLKPHNFTKATIQNISINIVKLYTFYNALLF